MKRQRLKGKMVRTCAACRTQGDKYTFCRIARVGDDVVADAQATGSGRGVYVCRNVRCVDILQKSKRADAALKKHVPESVYDALRQAICNEKETT